MCILSDHEIESALAEGRLGIDPFDSANLTPNGYDLTVKEVLLRSTGEHVRDGVAEVPPGGGFLISTAEYVRMPDDAAGQLWIRSSYARRGALAGFGKVEVGFEGELTIAAFNSASEPLKVPIGDRFCQLVFERMNTAPAQGYASRSGNYQGQRGITHARES